MGVIRDGLGRSSTRHAGGATEEALVRSMIEQQTTVNGRYRVDRRVGEGGMAVVFRGYDLLLGREVAIKALRPQYAADPAFRLRFEREARAAAGFRHPNIIQIFDVGEEQGAPYFVMEYVEGQTLAEIVAAEAPFHPDDVAALLRQLGAALDYAHERGYVHRDVKPQNILVDPDGHARVVDFGIAKGLGDSDLTATGTGLGTVQYISPEQASGLMATPASDIYSAGVVAFEMLTGRLPFEADSPVGVAMKHVNDEPPAPSDLLATIPPAVDAIVLRAMAKDPTQRFSSAGALAEAMGRWRRYLPPNPQSATSRWTQPTTPLPSAPAPAGTPRAAPTVRPSPAPRKTAKSSRGGTLLFGLLVLAGMIGLIWFGIRFAADIGRFGGAPAATTEGAPAPTAAVVAPTAGGVVEAPTFEPAIVVSDSPPPTIAPAAPTAAPQAVAAPDLVGQSVDAARAALTPLGLTLQVDDPVESTDVPQGSIARQSPNPGVAVPAGGAVTVRPSSGPAAVDLDALHLLGMSADRAERALQAANLAVQRIDVGSQSVPAGDVVGLDPAHKANPGDTVTMQVSAGDKVQIPADLQGQTLARAQRRLQQLGFKLGDAQGVSRQVIESQGLDLDALGIQDGDVVGVQDHQFGDWVDPGERLQLVYYDSKQDNAA